MNKLRALVAFAFIANIPLSSAMDKVNSNPLTTEPLNHTRAQVQTSLPKEPSVEVFEIAKNLALQHQHLLKGLCEQAFQSFPPSLRDNLCVGLVGSNAWQEPTISSDIELLLLVKDYTCLKTVLEFQNALEKSFQDLNDSYFKLDLGEEEIGSPLRMTWIFTPEHAHAFAVSPKDTRVAMGEYVESFLTELDLVGQWDKEDLVNYLQAKAVELMGETLNVQFVTGNQELYEKYNFHRRTFAEPVSQAWAKNTPLSPSHPAPEICKALLNRPFVISNEKERAKICWRNISHIIRTLGYIMGAQTTGSLDTLRFLKDKEVITEQVFVDLLNKAQVAVWARLTESTGGVKEQERTRVMLEKAGLTENSMSEFYLTQIQPAFKN